MLVCILHKNNKDIPTFDLTDIYGEYMLLLKCWLHKYLSCIFFCARTAFNFINSISFKKD